ncbi:hypothetical protein M758_UG113700 [Ceratodon purpureus]|nr:hypothetical protein M758_UG113700 [Ceratodon purpureus]
MEIQIHAISGLRLMISISHQTSKKSRKQTELKYEKFQLYYGSGNIPVSVQEKKNIKNYLMTRLLHYLAKALHGVIARKRSESPEQDDDTLPISFEQYLLNNIYIALVFKYTLI